MCLIFPLPKFQVSTLSHCLGSSLGIEVGITGDSLELEMVTTGTAISCPLPTSIMPIPTGTTPDKPAFHRVPDDDARSTFTLQF
jgi:hypothetical protein